MNNANDSGPVVAPIPARKPTTLALLLQIFSLLLGAPALAWGVFIVWSTAFPAKCGDWSGMIPLGVVECWVVDMPIGLLILVIGLFVKKGSPSMRKVCIAAAIVILSLPIFASILLHRWHCP